MSFGSDGASVMTGKKNGTAAILRRSNPHMTNVHCIAHRWALCTSQASDSIPILKQHQQTLTDLFYYFKGSSKREMRLREVKSILDEPVIPIKELHAVRWLSYFNALTSVYRSLDSLLTYLQEANSNNNDPKAAGLKKKLACDKFLKVTYMKMDAMAPVTTIAQFFQTENVDVALVKVKLDMCLADLDKVKGLDTPYMQQLSKDFSDATYKGQHEITTTNFDLQKLTETFVDKLKDNKLKRFPDDDMLMAFGVLEMRPLSFLSKEERAVYGNTQIQQLVDFYGSSQTSTWKEDGTTHEQTTPPFVQSEQCVQEWTLAKEVVLAEMYHRDSMASLWQLMVKYHKEQFPNLLKLAQLAMTSAVHTAGCERGFSVQNAILTKGRSRLMVENQHKLMNVKLASSSIDYQKVVSLWRQARNRRL